MRLAIIVLLWSSVAFAQTYKRTQLKNAPAEVVAAEAAWATAESEKDAKAAAPKWEAAAIAFDKAVTSVPAGPIQTESAYAAVLAWKNAMASEPEKTPAKPTPDLTAREKSYVAAIDVFMPLAPAEEVPSMTFLKAHLFAKHDKLDVAVPLYESIISKTPEHETAEYAAPLLLDALNRTARIPEMKTWVEKMRAMPKLLAKRSELRQTLDELHVKIVRKDAEQAEADGENIRCARIYRELATSMPKYARKDELVFNAGVCFEKGGAKADAIQAFLEVTRMKTALRNAAAKRFERLQP